MTVRLRREIVRMSLEDMAASQGLTSSGWSRVETGKTNMTLLQLFRAAEVIGTTASNILLEVEELLRGLSR